MFQNDLSGEILTRDGCHSPCDVWVNEQLGTTEWVWKGLTLKTLSDIMGISIVGTKLSESFDQKKLQRPDIEYEYIEIDEKLRGN